jgi:hypothetical protein
MITLLISFAIAFVAAGFAFREARSFVRRKLRFVDAVQSPFAAIGAGIGTALVVGLLAPIIPFVSAGTALSIGLAVGMGVSTGAKDAKNGYYIAE